jgi:hypothetical protein
VSHAAPVAEAAIGLLDTLRERNLDEFERVLRRYTG